MNIIIDSEVLKSTAFIKLSNTARLAFFYFCMNRGFDSRYKDETKLTNLDIKRYDICKSLSTLTRVKKELVSNGLLDQCDPKFANQFAFNFIFSDRWKLFGTKEFDRIDYVVRLNGQAPEWKEQARIAREEKSSRKNNI